jgi:twitching motility protein PilT
MDIGKLLQMAIEKNASDIHLVVGKPATFRVDGELNSLDGENLTPAMTEEYVKSIASQESIKNVQEHGGTDFGFSFGGTVRFRVSAFRQKGYYSLVLRLIPNKILTLDEIGLPASIADILAKPRGLILITGPTGSGKTTTLASMIDYLNSEKKLHILTVEDPIEYYHGHKKGIVTQRELGIDVPSFSEALRRGLRQDPDVLLVGEMRDLETMEAAIAAAETGHLVFATLHTTGAARTVDRILDAFPPSQQEQIRAQLASSVLAVISQLLLPRKSGGRIAAFEIMVATPAIQNLIREKKTYQITSEIQTGAKYGMKTLDAWLLGLFRKEEISHACAAAVVQDVVQFYLKTK